MALVNSLQTVSPKAARWQMFFSMAIFGTIGLFSRYTTAISSAELSLYRAVSAAVLIGAGFLFFRRRLSLSDVREDVGVLLLSGGALGINWIFLFESFQRTSISLATLSYYFAPVLVTVICPLLFHETLSRRQILCFAMSTVGLILIVNVQDFRLDDESSIGVLYGLGAAVFYALFIILNKTIKAVESMERSFWQFAAAAIVLLPYVAMTGGTRIAALDARGWVCLAVLCIFHTVIMYYAYFQALNQLTGQEAALIGYIDPLVAVLISVAVFHEPMTMGQIIGGTMILGFTLWNECNPECIDKEQS